MRFAPIRLRAAVAQRRLAMEPLEPRRLLAADLVINEILAINDGVLVDEDGEYSDAIELFNRGDESANLGGWHLTDEFDDLTQWQFPSVELGAGEYLVVFASGKDRAVAGSELHLNFALSGDGEPLALVEPDGMTVASAFAPEFPQQFDDVSYGIADDANETVLVDQGADIEVLFPPDDSLETTWTETSFVPDASWQSGELAVGYQAGADPPTSEVVLQIDINDRDNPTNTQAGFESFVVNGSGTETAPVTRSFGDIDVTLFNAGVDPYDDRMRATPINAGDFTEAALLQDFVFSRAESADGGIDVLVEGLVPDATYTLTAWSFDTGSNGLRVSNWTANGISAIDQYGFNGSAPPVDDETYRFGVAVQADAAGEILLSGRYDELSSHFAVFLNALRIETGDTLNGPGSVADVLRVDFNDRTTGETGVANTESGFVTMTLDENGATFDGVQFTFSAFGGAVLDDRDRPGPADVGDFTLNQVYDDFIFANSPVGGGLEVFIEGLAPSAQYDLVIRSLDPGASPGTRSSTWTEESSADPIAIATPYTFDSSHTPTSNDENLIRTALTTSAEGTLLLRGVHEGANPRVAVNAIELTRANLSELIQLDVESEMLNQRTDAYVRAEFFESDAATVDQLFLDMQYDAGFVAYLNGQEVARRNAPTAAGVPPAAGAAATAERAISETLAVETIDLTAQRHLLVSGPNVLAIHGLNSAVDDEDFLLAPRLRAGRIEGQSNRYFETPTLGSANGRGVIGFVEEVEASVEHGFHDEPFLLTLSTATAGADIYYTLDGSIPSPSNAGATKYDGAFEIATTTMLRTAAIRDQFGDSSVDTQTYIFLDDVLTQDPLSGPDASLYPTIWQANATGDYSIDPEVVARWDDDNPANTDFGIREALASLPTMSIVLDHDDLWDRSTGIYPNATSQGSAWRRPGSIEYFDPATGDAFQYNVGVQMHGSASRDNVRLKKHSFRLIFNSEFDGPGTLREPLFDNSDFDDINTVVMRASFTDSFATRTITGRYSPLDSTYTRDVFVRDTQLAMGSHSPDSTFVHLYINGLYWGMYSPAERTDDAFLASRIGGQREDWDVVRDFNELFRGSKAVWNEMFDVADQIAAASPAQADALFMQLQGLNADGAPNAAFEPILDVDNFIDYMILHLHAGVEDWPSHNWVAARNRVDPGLGFQFFTWDQEISYDGRFRDRTEASNDHTPGELFVDLRNSPEFRVRFGDRVQKHMFNDGALTVAANQARWQWRADQVEAAIIGESARWGDAREGQVINVPPQAVVPTMTVDHWRASIAEVHDDYFPQHHDLALSRFAADRLWPLLAAPQFNQHGGAVLPGFAASLTGAPADGQIYYTLDGADPRLTGGALNSDSAMLFGGDIVITETTTVKSRILNNGRWSPIVEATFAIAPSAGAIVVSEINYHPYNPTAAELATIPGVDAEEFEFIEVLNVHPTDPINLLNMSLSDGVTFTFGDVSLASGERAVVVENLDAFEARYGTGRNVVGQWSGGLSNNGETIELLDGLGNLLVSFAYGDSDPWSPLADGDGATLELIDPAETPAPQLRKYHQWRTSAEFGGSPGTAGTGPIGPVVNEVLAHTDDPEQDAIELFNPTSQTIDLSGWFLSDSADNFLKYELPAGTVLASNEYVVFDEDDFNPAPSSPGPNDFALDGVAGDQVYLVVPDGAGGVAQFVDVVEFGGMASGESQGRVPNGAGRLAPLANQSLGFVNGAARIGPLILSEVNYHPDDPSPAALAIDPTMGDNDLEFVEIHNPTDAAIDLFDWRIRGEVDFDFATGNAIEAGATLVVVPFDPHDPANFDRRDAFRIHYGIDESVDLVGGFSRNLQNSFAIVRLERPDDPPPGNPLFTPHIWVDEVLYDDASPWPTAADGEGSSLTRAVQNLYGNDAASWTAADPTPGTASFNELSADFNDDGLVDGFDLLAWQRGFGASPANKADGDANADGEVNQTDLGVWEVQFGTSTSTSSVVLAFASAASASVVDSALSAEPRTQSSLVDDAFAAGTHAPVIRPGRELFKVALRHQWQKIVEPEDAAPAQDAADWLAYEPPTLSAVDQAFKLARFRR